MNKNQILGFVRHALTIAGGYLVAKDYITDPMLQEGIAALMILIGLGWSFVSPEKKA